MTSHQYVPMGDGTEFAVACFSEGVVALDVAFFTDRPEGRALMLDRVCALAEKISSEFALGRYWIYSTGHGAHVIFEEELRGWNAVETVLSSAAELPGWHEDRGHVGVCRDVRRCTLRVGRKPGRGFDIEPWFAGSANAPSHVQEHDALVAQMLPALRR